MPRAYYGEGNERRAEILRRLRSYMIVQWRIRRVPFMGMVEAVSETGADPEWVLAEWRKYESRGEAWIDFSRRRLPALWREPPARS